MGNVFLISDTHFFDEDILRYERRPFNDVEEMNDTMIRRWNNAVKPDDTIIHLGDVFGMNSYIGDETVKDLISSKLNGHKILIMGNHDQHKTPKEWMDYGFEMVSKYPIIYDGFFILSHEPMYVSSNSPLVNLYGHIHSNNMYKDYSENSFCCCVERILYTPINLPYIKEKIMYCRNQETPYCED